MLQRTLFFSLFVFVFLSTVSFAQDSQRLRLENLQSKADSLESVADSLRNQKFSAVDSLERKINLIAEDSKAEATLEDDVEVTENPGSWGNVVTKLEEGTTVNVLRGDGDDNSYVKISYNDKSGWVHRTIAFYEEFSDLIPKNSERLADIRRVEEKVSKVESKFDSKISKVENKIQGVEAEIQRTENKIENIECTSRLGGGSQARAACMGVVEIGMTEDMVREAWGYPDDRNITETQYTRREQWVYEVSRFERKYVYIENGEVTAIQK